MYGQLAIEMNKLYFNKKYIFRRTDFLSVIIYYFSNYLLFFNITCDLEPSVESKNYGF